MKKVLTIAVAAVMAFSLSMPAFAAATEGQMANEGKLVQQIGHALAQDNVEAATAAAEDVVTLITDGKTDVSALTAGHLQAVLGKLEEQGSAVAKTNSLNQSAVTVTGEAQTAQNVVVNDLQVHPAAGDNAATITLVVDDTNAADAQSGLGYKLTLDIPTSQFSASADPTCIPKLDNVHLVYEATGQKLDSVLDAYIWQHEDGPYMVRLIAWVPHFSTYNVVFAPVGNVNQPILPGEGGGDQGGNNGGDQGGNSGGDNGGSNTPAATPAPAPAAANPIKKTGADMSVALTALAVVAGVALVGGVVAMKKSDLDQ